MLQDELKMILDVGCGSRPCGDVNLDLFQGDTPHHIGFIDGRQYMNFTQGSADTLPFRDGVFDLVYISHVLEHLPDTHKALRELARVTSKAAIIRVPNNPLIEHPEHLYTWSQTSLENTLKRHFKTVKVTPYSSTYDIQNSRLFKTVTHFKVIGLPLGRWLRRRLGVELVAYCLK